MVVRVGRCYGFRSDPRIAMLGLALSILGCKDRAASPGAGGGTGGSAGGRSASFEAADGPLGSWRPIVEQGAPRLNPPLVGVWGGGRLWVWGGGGCTPSGFCNEGKGYDPLTGSWQSMATEGAPAPRSSHSAVWTGQSLLIWGGQGCEGAGCDDGGAFDPATNTWRNLAREGAPSARAQHTAIWTGSQMIVWGGRSAPISQSSSRLAAGVAYDPTLDRWSALSSEAEPAPRFAHTAVWTGNLMIVWGGDVSNDSPMGSNDGGRYEPVANTWSKSSTTGAPRARYQHVAVWTGTEMLIWGGYGCGSTGDRVGPCQEGGAYDPATDRWRSIGTRDAPESTTAGGAAWSGTYLLLWGGSSNQGSAYDPKLDRWYRLSTVNAPGARTNHALAWTGDSLIVWGGLAGERTAYDGGLLSF